MRVLNQINYVGGLGADRWIGEGFKDAYEKLRHDFFWLTATDDFASRLEEIKPDVLMIGQDKLTDRNTRTLVEWRRRGLKVVVRVDSFFWQNPEVNRNLTLFDPADLYYGEVEDPWMESFKQQTGKRYVIIPNAANRRYHFPTNPVKKYQHDVVFLGAMMPNKKDALEMLLLPLKKKYDVKIYGPNWTVVDNAMRLAAVVSRKAGLYGLNRKISDLRISVPPEEENQLYSSAKICVNIHERAERIEGHVILNERTFKIPACGGFEICDFVSPLRKYFTEREMVMADNSNGDWVKDWFLKIAYYLSHDTEREEIKKAGTARALRDHTYDNRVKTILELLRQETLSS